MFNIGAGEMVLIAVAALLILGPQRLPELARAIGKFMREFRRQTDEVRNVVEREFYTMDTELNREPTPPVRPGLPFGRSPAPQVGAPDALTPTDALAPATPAEPSAAETQSPRAPLGLDGAELPEPPASSPAPEAESSAPAGEPASPTASSAPSESVGADGLPQLSPLPGTVARNAPKRS
ncbi:putative twin-arginine translocation protein TatB [Myxococcus stipitatus DSM 14675]|uniref:Sec-independent protein translocase protein TatB homolog n=1 Tax=Myxococcus stipitatus (strain DSM 14675 / JCM 12634 / Mx s8) TaxID=1278073 RepID=L7UIF1_MYXSD|nr:Sec-independent protein translocase protein TatB [Myxococcus stipitatus]AGC47793.1 putative twin-arginine translocation protein TatB [Myxococcus stipitatus DSM 14675]